jgi:hypothetical protein
MGVFRSNESTTHAAAFKQYGTGLETFEAVI